MAEFVEDLKDERATSLRARTARRSADARSVPAVEGRSRRALASSQNIMALQRSVGNVGVTSYLEGSEEERSPVYDTINGSGEALDPQTRTSMESHLGADFSDVRVHTDARSAESVGAAAYTVGNDIVMHPNHYEPGSDSGKETLAHELTHVVQQRSGPVSGTDAPGGIRLSDPGDRFEVAAEANAAQVMRQMEEEEDEGEDEEG